jgi:hypothetical protein
VAGPQGIGGRSVVILAQNPSKIGQNLTGKCKNCGRIVENIGKIFSEWLSVDRLCTILSPCTKENPL